MLEWLEEMAREKALPLLLLKDGLQTMAGRPPAAALEAWLALTREEALDPALPIVDAPSSPGDPVETMAGWGPPWRRELVLPPPTGGVWGRWRLPGNGKLS